MRRKSGRKGSSFLSVGCTRTAMLGRKEDALPLWITVLGNGTARFIKIRAGTGKNSRNELYARTDQVGFLSTQRVDGKLILPEAVQVLQMKASASSGS